MYAIIVHGGAGSWPPERERELTFGVRTAAENGGKRLAEGSSALEAVISAVGVLEDDPLFNAGTGSTLNLTGEAEMDAGVMWGPTLAAGNVAALTRVRSPVRVARSIMEHTDHVLLAGPAALRLARSLGYPDYDPITSAARNRWNRLRARMDDAPEEFGRLPGLLRDHPDLGGDTVGAVALDSQGALACATSTGGIALKLPGRVGDAPLPGAGHFADAHCAVAATGHGELMMRHGTARAVTCRVAAGMPLEAALSEVLDELGRELGSEAGLIGIDGNGAPCVDHRSKHMPHAVVRSGVEGIHGALKVGGEDGA
ncbi:isoaspartyl peptidase/L-asparaginase family protein [Thiohalorhabdus sp. Cl-TMA]|uniref:Isoaspartyl peptidase/L-asparaginase family protein n=1 Tax=Thiohalorhabdus methylotrophus TaxID=3242694 RepID=A0ABV4TQ71_9GAMM